MMTTFFSIIALICLAFIAWIFLSINTEGQDGAGFAKGVLIAMVALPAGVIVGGMF